MSVLLPAAAAEQALRRPPRRTPQNVRLFLLPFRSSFYSVLTACIHFGEHPGRALFEKCDDLLPSDGRKAFKEVINGIAALEIVHQRLDRDTGSGEDGSAAHYVRRYAD